MIAKRKSKIMHLAKNYEYWYFDTCSWMHEHIDEFLETSVDILRKQGRKIILFDEVEKELLRHAAARTVVSMKDHTVVIRADHALNIIDQLGDDVVLKVKTASSKYADRNIIESIIHILGDHRMLVVTSDRKLARDIMTHIHGYWDTMNAQMVCVEFINQYGGLSNWANDKEINLRGSSNNSYYLGEQKGMSVKFSDFYHKNS